MPLLERCVSISAFVNDNLIAVSLRLCSIHYKGNKWELKHGNRHSGHN